MWGYVLRRIVYFIPTLIIISLLAFIISLNAPGDPVDRLLNASQGSGEMLVESPVVEQQRKQLRERMGLHLPVFYFSINALSQPATSPNFLSPQEQKAYRHLVSTFGNHQTTDAVYNSMQSWYNAHRKVLLPNGAQRDSVLSTLNYSTAAVKGLLSAGDPEVIARKISELNELYARHSEFQDLINYSDSCNSTLQYALTNSTKWKNYIPVIRIHPNNQYHRWLFGDGNWITGNGSEHTKGWIRGDMGTSYSSQLPVSNIIASRIKWSLFFTLISVFLAYLISIPIGLLSASKRNSLFDRGSSVFLFMLYSLPVFWVATLLLMNFANPDVVRWFPSSGVAPTEGIPEGASLLERVRLTIPYLVLPTICFTYAQLAFLSRLTRVAALDVLGSDFIRTARAKGLSEKTVLYKHTFRNALLPLITVFATVFPAAVGGSVILETIFTIPGMGREIIEAIYQKDYPVIISVFTITGILTLVGYLIADILYALADPRIDWKK